jgi:hypothetical protein
MKPISQYGLVAVFDILGYQEFLDKNPVNYQVDVVSDTLEKIPNETMALLNEMFGESNGSALSSIVLSDSIIFTIPLIQKDAEGQSYNSDEIKANFFAWNRMLLGCAIFMRKMFDAGFPLRGALTLGHYFSAESWLVGQPLVKAYRETTKQEWSGCILSVVAGKGVDKICAQYGKGKDRLMSFVFKYEVPLKDGAKEERYVCNWAAEKSTQIFLPIPNPRDYVLRAFVQHKKGVSERERQKVDNTEAFLWYFKENVQKFAEQQANSGMKQ